MKTFTTYAEKKAKQILNLLQGYTRGIRITAILILLLMGVSNAWADTAITFSGGHIYFADTHNVHKGVTQLAARKSNCSNGDWYTAVTTLSNIENTKLYYTNTLEGSGWQNVCWNGWCLISNSSAKSNTGDELWNSNHSTWWSSYDSYGLYNNSPYVITVASDAKGAQKTTEYISNGYSDLNSQQTINTVVDGTVANSKATISLTSYKMTGNGAVTKQEATHGTGSKDSYITAARTATTTLEVGDVATGYQFDGWYTAATGGTQLEADETYTYYPTAATTVYARFSTKQHTVNFKVHSSGHGSLTAKVGDTSINYGDKVNYGSEVVFTATPSAGYQIEGWYSNSACTTPIDNGTNKTYTVTIKGGTNVYVKFVEYCLVTFLPNPPRGLVYPGQINPQELVKGEKAVPPTVVELEGYLFGGWYPNGSAFTDANKFDFDTPIEHDIELCARWIPYEQCIFFKNNLNWDNIYVYTFSNNVWHNGDNQENPNDDMGVQPKVNLIEHGKMTRIGFTDVYYYALTNITTGFNYIAFSDQSQPDHTFLYKCNAIYRGDRSDKMQLFIPQREGQVGQKRNDTYYYSEGIWMKYNSTESGYKWSSDKNGWSTDTNPFTAPDKGGYSFSTKVSLQGGTTYKFKVNNINGDWYGKIHTMTKENCTNLWLEHRMEEKYNTTIQPNVTGEYIFTIYLGDGKVMISLEYPLDINDYRLAYNDNTTGFHPGHYIRKRLAEEQLDTVSFFVHKDYSPKLLLQKCTAIDAAKGTAKWETVGEAYPIDVNSTSVYNFVLQQTGTTDATHQATVLMDKTHLYTGNFYIRTDKAPGGWDYFRQEDNMIHFSSYASDHEHFTHYFCKWIESSEQKGYSNVKYTIANDYSYCISDTLDNDDVIKNNQTEQGFLPANANVRFTWNNKDNTLSRAYISGSTWTRDRFLVLSGNDQLFDINIDDETGAPLFFPEGTTNGSRDGLHANEAIFADMGNWIYQLDVHANNLTTIKLTALYNEVVQYFKGSEKESTTLLRSTAGKNYKIRLIYDFKINKLISAWLAGDETIAGQDQTLGADMMIIRHNQEKAEQLNFDPTSRQLTDVRTAYAVMTFDKYFLNNRAEDGSHLSDADKQSPYARALYWISFPFDVKLSEVFGFGEYGDYWIMEYYDGEARAINGLWADTDTYWKYITNKNYILQKGQGYVISLNLNKMGYESNIFDNTDEVSLYFPSNGALGTITGVPTNYYAKEHECTIDRENGIHKIYDSHWNVIGVPGFADIENVEIGDHLFTQDSIHFYYEYLPQTNEYRTRRAGNEKTPANFQTMYSYMVQYYGGINWSTKTFTGPSAIAARRTGAMPSQYDLRLELTTDDQLHDQTFLLLDEDKRATAEYDVNLDLTKIMNKNASIYTLAGEQRITLSGNTLPMEKVTVPVGVMIATAGTYTFRMPDGTDGIAVTLVDNATGTHTNMLMSEYTVTLNAGTIENRFYLVVDPDRTATSVENVGSGANGDEAKGVEKFLIDGKLFIRTTDGIFDAKGQRLQAPPTVQRLVNGFAYCLEAKGEDKKNELDASSSFFCCYFFAKHLRISKKKCTFAASFLQKHTKNCTKTLQKHTKTQTKLLQKHTKI